MRPAKILRPRRPHLSEVETDSTTRYLFLLISLGLLALLTGCAAGTSRGDSSGVVEPHPTLDEGIKQRHLAPIPAEYQDLTNPVAADAESLDRGKTIYQANCAVCHGQAGWGDGPAAANLDPAPVPLAQTAPTLSDAYLFYRISEGGNFAPFNSTMPAFKVILPETEQRWDVINYIRSLGNNSTKEK